MVERMPQLIVSDPDEFTALKLALPFIKESDLLFKEEHPHIKAESLALIQSTDGLFYAKLKLLESKPAILLVTHPDKIMADSLKL